MDRDFALALAESDIQATANSVMSSSTVDLPSGKNA